MPLWTRKIIQSVLLKKKKVQKQHTRENMEKSKTPVGGSAMHNVQEEHMTPREKMLLARKKQILKRRKTNNTYK